MAEIYPINRNFSVSFSAEFCWTAVSVSSSTYILADTQTNEDDKISFMLYNLQLNRLNSVCSIRHDFYGGCRDSAEGGRFCHA